MNQTTRSESTPGEIVMIICIFAGVFLAASAYSVANGFPVFGFTDRALLESIGIELFAAALAICILYLRGWRYTDFEFELSARLTALGVALFFVGWGVEYVYEFAMRSVIPGADMLDRISRLSDMSWATIVLMSLVNGVYEEYFLTHYLVRVTAVHGPMFALGLSALIRVGYHFYQGPFGAVSVLLWGLVVTAFYWRFRKVWPVMVAHVLTDIAALGSMID